MPRSISVHVSVSHAAYQSQDRMFSKVTFQVTQTEDMPTEIFVVRQPGDISTRNLINVAVPSELTEIPPNAINSNGVMRVNNVSVLYDRPIAVQEVIQEIKDRIQLLIDTMDSLDLIQESFDFTVTG